MMPSVFYIYLPFYPENQLSALRRVKLTTLSLSILKNCEILVYNIVHSRRHALNSFQFLSAPKNCCKRRRQVEYFNLIMNKHRWVEQGKREKEWEKRHGHGTTSSRSAVTCVTCHAHQVLKYQISCDTHTQTYTMTEICMQNHCELTKPKTNL